MMKLKKKNYFFYKWDNGDFWTLYLKSSFKKLWTRRECVLYLPRIKVMLLFLFFTTTTFDRVHPQLQLGVDDISMKNYRKPINQHFWNYRQLIDIEKWKFWNYRKIIDIGKCIKFGPINTSKAKVSEMKFQQFFTKKMQTKLPLLALLPWREVLIQYWYSCTDSYAIDLCAILCLFDAILCPVDVFCCRFALFWALLSRFTLFTPFCCKIRNMHISRGEIIEKIIESR